LALALAVGCAGTDSDDNGPEGDKSQADDPAQEHGQGPGTVLPDGGTIDDTPGPPLSKAEGLVVKSPGAATVYWIRGGKKNPFASAGVMASWGIAATDVIIVPEAALGGVADGQPVLYREGSLVRGTSKTFVIDMEGQPPSATWKRRALASNAVMAPCHFAEAWVVADAAVDGMPYADGAALAACTDATLPDGMLVRAGAGAEVFLVEGGKKSSFASPDALASHGYPQNRIVNLPAAAVDGYPKGATIGFREGSLVRRAGTITPYSAIFRGADGAFQQRPFPSSCSVGEYFFDASKVREATAEVLAQFPAAPAYADICPAPAAVNADGNGDFNIGPTYKDAPEMTVAAGVPRGTVYKFTMSSATSKVYPGLTGAYTRDVSVYVPKQYVDGAAAPFMVVQDGAGYVANMTAALDTLINAKRVPVMIAIMINSGGGDGRGSERGLEYDRVHEDYTRFIETEVLPIIPKNADIQKTYKNLKFTTNPEGRASAGTSSGGAAAFTMAWFRPDLYRRVLTYSGTYVNQHPETAYPHSAWEYHEHLLKEVAAKPIRVTLEVGQNDNNLDATYKDGMHNWLTANKAMAAVLKSKSYAYRYHYAADAKHGDQRAIRQTLPDNLVWLWKGYVPPASP